MPVFGVICEYDPFHLGHRWMLEQLRQQGPVVCAMSGCFTQRGEFAAVSKFARAEMAVRNGADLVLELPTPLGSVRSRAVCPGRRGAAAKKPGW